MKAPAAERPRLAARLPEPGRFWIRYAPREWPGPEGLWTDLSTAGLGRAAGAASTEGAWPSPVEHEPLDDVVYLPPVSPRNSAARGAIAREHLALGTPILVQEQAGRAGPGSAAGAVCVIDPLSALLAGDLAALDRLPEDCPEPAVVWPLVVGLTDDPALWEEGCMRLAGAGAATVQALALDLDPADRRRLVEICGERAFEPLFHRPPPSTETEREFARTASRHGLAPFLRRPLPPPPAPAAAGAGLRAAGPANASNRRIAGDLGLAAELWLRVGRPEGPGQALYAAARQADRTPYDLAALAREENLATLTWLDAAGRRVVEESAAGEEPALLAALLAEYLAPAPSQGGGTQGQEGD
ncbi:MAG TPA: hypothetical protein VIH93_12725 [Thermoanaerobaculia bacterium]|jgi:hypothetical protein